jgi:hypothetical protein
MIENRPAEFARVAFIARQKSVVHDRYDELLSQGGAPQSNDAATRISAAREAIAKGDDGIRAFLDEAASSRRA